MKPSPNSTILVVDDDRLVLAALAHGLETAGYRVLKADNGDDAILLAREHRPDLALLDIRMQGKSGFDVAAYLRVQGGVPFVFLSAFSDAQTLAQAHALGAIACLAKPLDVAQLLLAVAAALEQAARLAPGGASPAVAGNAAETRPASDVVAMAVGVLMQRHSLSRRAAAQQLDRLAAAARLTVAEQAEALLLAVESLVLPAAS